MDPEPETLSDGDTVELVAVMPTVELHLPTQPMARVDLLCAWCTQRLSALNAKPWRFTIHDKDGYVVDEKWFHPGGCYQAYSLRHYGFIPDTVEPWGPLL